MATEAERLKSEGNALFTKNDFSGAYNKYTEALKHDDKNAILYCNRAASSLGLNRFMDAAADAGKATELDPGYAKAWGRLAATRTGLSRPDLAAEALKRAIAALPAENLTPAQQRQRDQYKQDLASAEAKVAQSVQLNNGHVTVPGSQAGQVPWKRAAALLPGLAAQSIVDSSAWIVAYAYEDWERAMNGMKMGREMHTPHGPGYYGQQGIRFSTLFVIEGLSNAILTDSRIFHMTDINWVNMYNKQMMFELTAARAGDWADSGSKRVIEEFPARLNREGWDSARPALSISVRAWIMRAYLDANIKRSAETGLEFLKSALEVLAWGTERYRDVPNEDKGAIFQPTFIRGIKCMRLDMLMTAYSNNPGANSKYSLEDLLASADEVLAELMAIPGPPTVESVGFHQAFYLYPAAVAHTVRAFYYRNKGHLLRQAQGPPSEVSDLYRMAGREYMEAVKLYPMDDERYAWFTYCAFNVHWDAGAPLKYLLAFLDQLEMSIPLMKKIWEFSADAPSGRDALFQRALEQRRAWLDDINSGRISQEDLDTMIVQRV
ncbi:hypothetical protein C8Q76DRAFT_668229 [Earliella scabrosa]|nr:hypothetical protein C8Q76DRAFT_668229 [Earliella scabrosa]